MKKKLTILILLLTLNSFCQLVDSQNDTDSLSYNKHTEYFKKRISPELLNEITFPKNSTSIEVSFYVNKEIKPFYINANTGRNTKLNEAIIKSFKKYPLENFDIDFDTRKKYSFQVIIKKDYKNIIACSTTLNEIKSANSENCSDLDFYVDIEKCIDKQINTYIHKKIDYSLAKESDSINNISLKIESFIDQNGFLRLKKIKAPTYFEEHIKKIIEKYPETLTPKSKNNNSINYNHIFSINFKPGETPKIRENNIFNNFDSVFKPSRTNSFSEYISKNLSLKEINNANLNRFNKRLSIYFELDKKGKPFSITTNSRSNNLEEKIIGLLKNYDFNKFTFINKNHLNSYFTPILCFENNKNIVKTNNIIGYYRTPIFKKCKHLKNTRDAKICFSKQIQLHFVKNFNKNLPNRLGLTTGRKRVFIGFRVNKKGKIDNIKVKSPHKKITKEVIKVMKKLPTVIPPIYGNKPANIKYSIPLTLVVE